MKYTNDVYNNITQQQKNLALQRLTALWAFVESGLGGVLHALNIPFTGLVVGGFAVIIITLIAKFSDTEFKQILKSLSIVLLIKVTISPNTPFPAYIAVSFQAFIGYVLFSILNINFGSILLFSVLAMLESAIQKLLVLTLFFGQSMWKAINIFTNFVGKQFNCNIANGSYWLIGIYLSIYFFAAIGITFITYKIITNFSFTSSSYKQININLPKINNAATIKMSKKKTWIYFTALAIISTTLFFIEPNSNKGFIVVAKTISWTLFAIFSWYIIITPLFKKLIVAMLKNSKTNYSNQVAETMNMLPFIKIIAINIWQQSKQYKGFNRICFFLSTLMYYALTHTYTPISNSSE